MNNFKLKKLLTLMAVTFIAAVAISPIKASAAWRQDSNGWWNTEGSSYSIGWKNIDNAWYYFNSNGYMKTGWVNDGGTWYYTAPSGEMKTGWVNDGGKWYYTASSGAMQTGWMSNNGAWYYLNTSGDMKTGLAEVNGKTYYLSESGAMKTGNVTINGVNYTFATSGEKVNSAANTNTTATSTGSGSSGGSSSSNSSSSSTDTSKYKDLYGTYTVGDCVSTDGTLSKETLQSFKGKQITIEDNGIDYKGTTVPTTSITENTMTSSDFKKQYKNVEVSGDTVKAVSSTLNYKGITEDITVYTAKDKNNQEVHYASAGGALIELKK